jgi:hypothetical protein
VIDLVRLRHLGEGNLDRLAVDTNLRAPAVERDEFPAETTATVDRRTLGKGSQSVELAVFLYFAAPLMCS